MSVRELVKLRHHPPLNIWQGCGTALNGTYCGNLPVGRYSVVIHLIAWEDEPGSVNADGTSSETALSDFVVLINAAVSEQDTFRSAVETFDPMEH
ncbi:hypothetical protein [Streptomyces sp. NPDC047841]|uniref:hypothetical protein n=1 Tax=Streptomyces sp. NPDC047841 TaxID=3154708 RepID=UPI0034545F4A